MAGRVIISFDKEWRFHNGDFTMIRNRWAWGKSGSWNQGPEGKKFDDNGWQRVELPHDFVIATEPKPYMEKEFDEDNTIMAMENLNNIHTTAGSFSKGVGWYRKHFFIPKEYEGKKLFLVFEGIYRDSSAYLNEFFIGAERSGYKQITYDITDFVNYGEDNLIAVRADARQAEGWFYEGGGIYRHAYILVTEQEHVADTFVHCDVNIENRLAQIHVTAECEEADGCIAEVSVLTADGCIVAQDSSRVEGMKAEVTMKLDNAILWDTESPYLYTAGVILYDRSLKEADSCKVRFGIRTAYFDADKGFILNGRQVKIKGVCCHQNHGGLGTAIPDEVYRYRMNLIKKMGANAFRTSHYPPAPELLSICDELGILVMDETRLLSSESGDLEQLACMVKRDRNHPCVILYSIGNEEAQSQTTKQGARIAETMIKHIKQLDPYTPVTMALLMWDLKNKRPITNIDEIAGISAKLDVAGFNYHEERYEEYHSAYKKQPMICTEQGTFKSTRGCYETDSEKCWLAICDKNDKSYMAGAAQWRACKPEWLSGLFIWTGLDYYGEPTPYAWPAISSQFGTMDICGFPKDFYYYYKAWWSNERVLHIFPHWNLCEGSVTDIYVFSNCEEIELFVNGLSIGRKRMEQDGYLVWKQVSYAKGELLGIGYTDGTECMRESIKTTGEPYKVCLTVDYEENDIKIIKAGIVDKNGQLVPDCNEQLSFFADNGKILGTSNGNPSDHAAPNGSDRCTFNGLAQVIIRTEGSTKLTVKAQRVKGAELVV